MAKSLRAIVPASIVVLSLCVISPGCGSHQEVGPAPETGNPYPGYCPVMGDSIDPQYFVDHEGKRYYLCCASCVPKFKKDPERFIKNPAEPVKE